GNEYVTVLLNECSQISWSAQQMIVTRLAQKVEDRVSGGMMIPKMYYDENPPDKGHWTYQLFKQHIDPETKQPLINPSLYAAMQLNPIDNRENLPESYLASLEQMAPRRRKRFFDGEFRDTAPDALFADELLDKWRLLDKELPEMLRIVVAIDPSGAGDTDNQDNDDIGIVVCGLGIDGNGYLLEDLTCKAGPATWGNVAIQAFHRWRADRIVAETNFGGAMVKDVIQSRDRKIPFRPVHASRGKVVRAEPISVLAEEGKIRMGGIFRELEDELTGFTSHGYTGERSPNRADAMVWGFHDLFPDLVRQQEKPKTRAPIKMQTQYIV
ncbi:MAG: phage terminase large subunit, partial [Candidatus Saccharimonadales bacterium]